MRCGLRVAHLHIDGSVFTTRESQTAQAQGAIAAVRVILRAPACRAGRIGQKAEVWPIVVLARRRFEIKMEAERGGGRRLIEMAERGERREHSQRSRGATSENLPPKVADLGVT